MDFKSLAIHAGHDPGSHLGAVITPIFCSMPFSEAPRFFSFFTRQQCKLHLHSSSSAFPDSLEARHTFLRIDPGVVICGAFNPFPSA